VKIEPLKVVINNSNTLEGQIKACLLIQYHLERNRCHSSNSQPAMHVGLN